MKKGIARIIFNAMIFLVILFFTISGVYFSIAIFIQLQSNRSQNIKLMKNETDIVKLGKYTIDKDMSCMFSDISYLKYIFQDNIKAYGNSDYTHLIENWKAFLVNKEIYYKLRFIDTQGNEIIKISYKSGNISVSPLSKMENKKGRYYFTETMKLAEDQIYLSDLDLDIENNKISLPIQPVLRLSTKVYDSTGTAIGMVIISYDARNIFNDIRNISSTSLGSISLINGNGYWLYNSADKSREWAFMYEDNAHTQLSLNKENPDLWLKLNQGNSGNITTNYGLYCYQAVSLFNSNTSAADINTVFSSGKKWLLVSYIPTDKAKGVVFNDDLSSIALYTLEKQRLIFFVILVVSTIITSMYTTLRESKKKMTLFSLDPLTHVYNRKAGFELLEKTHKKMLKNNGRLSVCFIDVNHLKEVNDTFGHDTGDDLITCVINVVKKYIRKSDFIIRNGGDEFLIIFVNADFMYAEAIWAQICQAFDVINQNGNKPYEISVSHGIEEFKLDINEFIENIVSSADEKMYNEKRYIHQHLEIIRK